MHSSFHLVTVGKQSPWYLPFVYTSLVCLTIRIASNVGKYTGHIFFNTCTIICGMKSPMFGINYFQSEFSDCCEHSWNYGISSNFKIIRK